MRGELLVGAHMSIAGGIHRAFERGRQAGCRALQIFLKNSNQWQGKALTHEDRRLYAAGQKESGIAPVLAHCSYLINLASPDKALRRKSLAAFVAHRGAGEAAGIATVASGLNQALDQIPPPVSILLENTAGQGSSIGHSFEQLAAILAGVRDEKRIGFCLDTCHLYAAGYDISTGRGYRKVLREFDRLIGI
jgi:deoxyribonuclease-4